ncbi:hypothetical protein ScPMuIL_012977 [Solemya velum]
MEELSVTRGRLASRNVFPLVCFVSLSQICGEPLCVPSAILLTESGTTEAPSATVYKYDCTVDTSGDDVIVIRRCSTTSDPSGGFLYCVPAVRKRKLKRKLTCVNRIADLSCPADQKMSIASVFYGRLDKTTCVSPHMYSTNCQDVSDAATYVKTLQWPECLHRRCWKFSNGPVLGN